MYPRRDSNSHLDGFKPSASAVGLRGLGGSTQQLEGDRVEDIGLAHDQPRADASGDPFTDQRSATDHLRAQVIGGGALICERIARRVGAGLIVSETDILDAVALELLG